MSAAVVLFQSADGTDLEKHLKDGEGRGYGAFLKSRQCFDCHFEPLPLGRHGGHKAVPFCVSFRCFSLTIR